VKELLAPEVRAELERRVLPEYLAKRRWFAAKGERLLGVRITGTAALPGANGAVVMTEVEARLPDRTERYALPLAGVEEKGDVGPLAAQLAVSRLRQGRRVGYLTTPSPTTACRTRCSARCARGSRCRPTTASCASFPGPTSANIALPSPTVIRRPLGGAVRTRP
jgi:maltose alpha-D-glucosyltransferase/alpha-amylase